MASQADSVVLQTILEKLTLLEESIKDLNVENTKRAQEIAMIAKHNNLIETEDESSSNRKEEQRLNSRVSAEQSETNRPRDSSPLPFSENRISTNESQNPLVRTKDKVRTIEVLNGKETSLGLLKKHTSDAVKQIYC